MSTPKAEVALMLETLPDGSGFEDIQYRLYVLEKVNRGLERAAGKDVISHERANARLGKWLAAEYDLKWNGTYLSRMALT